MKAILSASIYTLLATGGFSEVAPPEASAPQPRSELPTPAATAKPDKRQPNSHSYITKPGEAQRFDMQFPGGTATEFVEKVKETLGETLNVIIAQGSESAPIPPLEVYRVTTGSLFSAVTAATGERVSFQSQDPPDSPGAIWTIRELRKEAPGARHEVRFFPIAKYLPRFTVEDITAAIEAGWALQNKDWRATAVVKFHDETKLLICAASSEQLGIIPQVLAGLDEVPFPRSHQIIERSSKLIIPRLEFRDATLTEAVEFIKRKSFELDPTDRPERGINIVLHQTENVKGSRVTLTLANVSVMSALQTVASLSGLDLQVTDVAIILKQSAQSEDSSPGVENQDPAGPGDKRSTGAQTPKAGPTSDMIPGSPPPLGDSSQPRPPVAK